MRTKTSWRYSNFLLIDLIDDQEKLCYILFQFAYDDGLTINLKFREVFFVDPVLWWLDLEKKKAS